MDEFDDFVECIQFPGLQINKYLGRGRFSRVYDGVYQNLQVAVKIFEPNLQYNSQERTILQEIRNIPHAIKMIAAPDDFPLIIMEKKIGYQAKELLQIVNIQNIKFILKCILECLSNAHEKGIVHQDLTLGNIIVSRNMDEVTIIDWGSACKVSINMSPQVGSRMIRSPEMLLGYKGFGVKGDIWAVGCLILSFLCGGILPWNGSNTWNQLIEMSKIFGGVNIKNYANKLNVVIPESVECQFQKEVTLPLESFFSNDFKNLHDTTLIDLMNSLLEMDHAKRITAKDALEHPFFKDC